jgi:hypothetical protein
MYLISAIGYQLFPLSSSETGSFQDTMHMIVTGIVVALMIVSLLMLIVSFRLLDNKPFHMITNITFGLLLTGAVFTGAMPKEYFGLAERLSVYSVVLYLGVISLFNYMHHRDCL